MVLDSPDSTDDTPGCRQLLIAGAGIGGLAAALATTRAAGWQSRIYEGAAQFGEVGAGLQLGPNVTRVLHEWGLGAALKEAAAFPSCLRVRSVLHGRAIARMPLDDFSARYGAPYATMHRADLHALLLQAVRQTDAVLNPASRVVSVEQAANGVRLTTEHKLCVEGDAMVAADGIWSETRSALLHDGPATPTGHLAYRAVVLQDALPAALRSNDVTAWLGPRMHAVTYPVRRGEMLNVVVFVHGQIDGDTEGWNHAAVAADLRAAMGPACAALKDLIEAAAQWKLWVLCDRPPMSGAHEMAQGRVALLGDAGHPMRPYLAQGAGMAIEDAYVLGQSLALGTEIGVPAALKRYADLRWRRAARVQARARRNGRIFHLTGPMRWARDASLGLLGKRLLDMPWLYGNRL